MVSVSLPPQGALQQLTFMMGDPAAASEHCHSYNSTCLHSFNLNRFSSPQELSPAWPEVWLRAADKLGHCWPMLCFGITQFRRKGRPRALMQPWKYLGLQFELRCKEVMVSSPWGGGSFTTQTLPSNHRWVWCKGRMS